MKKIKLSSSIMLTELEDDYVVFDEESGDFWTVDEIGAAIMTALTDETTLSEIVKNLIKKYDVEEKELIADITEFINVLRENQLIQEMGN